MVAFFKTLHEKWYHFLLALTMGLLVFLAIDALGGAFELAPQIASSFNGIGLITLAFLSTLLILLGINKEKISEDKKNDATNRMKIAYMIAIAIGVHNFGEGLAIGGAYALGEVSLGTLLIVGFMVHNITEGIAIVSPVSKIYKEIKGFALKLIGLGLIAGSPAILGVWIGGFSYSAILALIFLSIGAGAAVQVVVEVFKHMKSESKEPLINTTNAIGFICGLLIMYVTGLFAV